MAGGTRRSFERLRGMTPYGILNYEIFTAVSDLALLTFEQALHDRFLEEHHGTVVFVDPTGESQPFLVTYLRGRAPAGAEEEYGERKGPLVSVR